MLKLIIFDMDGVIIDSEFMGFAQLKEFINEIKTFPQEITHEQFSAIVGRSKRDLFLAIKTLSQSQLSIDEIGEGLLSYNPEFWQNVDYLSIFRHDIKHIIQFAKQHQIKLAVASSGQREHIERILTLGGVREEIDFVMSGWELAKSKPDPTIYLKVLEHFAIPAEQTVAIEDSSYGIAAAKGAGIPVIAYEETRIAIDQSQANFKCRDMLHILEMIKQLHTTNLN